MAKTTNLFGICIFAFIALFWTGVFKLITMCIDNTNPNFDIALDIMLLVCNIMFGYIMIRSCINFFINTRFIEERQKEAYDHFNKFRKIRSERDKIVYMYPIPEPKSYRKSRIGMILVCVIGISGCGISSFLVIANYL